MNNQTDKFVERFSGLFEKAGINLSKIEESKEEAQKV
jgi:peptidase E